MTNCRLSATFTAGSFQIELPYKIITETIAPEDLKSIVADVGNGGQATLRLSSGRGRIGIVKAAKQ